MMQFQITTQYPSDKYNLLGNTEVLAQIPDIKTPVIQCIRLNPDPNVGGDVYVRKGKSGYLITKNGLKKLADGAGIKMISSRHVVPTTCQKCAAVNAAAHTVARCGECPNQDVAYCVTIAVPQLTGEVLTVEDTHEIIVKNVTAGMSDAAKAEFMKHLPQICEAKALNGAIRTALHIKSIYTEQEIRKPFVVAYLVPNLNHDEVKHAAIRAMFASTEALFGYNSIDKTPDIALIESKVPEQEHMAIEAADGENIDQYVDDTYLDAIPEPEPQQIAPPQPQAPVQQAPQQYSQPAPQQYRQPVQQAQRQAPQQAITQDVALYRCSNCGAEIKENVWSYSTSRFKRALCYDCQKKVRGDRR